MHEDMLGGLFVCGDVPTSTALLSFVHFTLHTVHDAAGAGTASGHPCRQ